MNSFFIYLIIFIVVVLDAIFLIRKKRKNKIAKKSFKTTLFVIKIPPEVTRTEDKKPIKEKIAITEQFLNSLTGIKGPIVFEIAKPNKGTDTQFYLSVPKDFANFIESQLNSFFPDSVVKEADDYNIFHPEGSVGAVFLKQKDSWLLPINTYKYQEVDSIASILNAFSKIQQEKEGLSFQIVISPAPKIAKKESKTAVKNMKEGASLSNAIRGGDSAWKMVGKGLKDAITLNQAPSNGSSKPKTVDEEALKSLQEKIAKPLFSVNLRILSSASNHIRAQEILSGLLGSFQQFNAPLKNYFKAVKPRRMKNFIFNYVFRIFNKKEAQILNTEEIASFWHFPVKRESAPKVEWSKVKETPPPARLPDEGVILGKNIFRGEEKIVRMTLTDRRRHFYLIGQTGVGKSYLQKNMIIQDIKAGHGIGVIDPHGDLIEDVLAYIPESRRDDVIVFNPGDLERPLGLNMLEYDFNRPEQKTFIINELMNIFDKLYDLKATGGPMFEQYVRNALGLIMSDRDDPATLLDIQRVFTDEDYRERKLKKCSDPTIIEFWEKEVARVDSGETSLENMTPYITSKFSTFVSNDYMRPIIAQPKSAFNFRDIMDNKKILLINLSKGRLGDINAFLLGLVCVGRLQIAAMSRVDIPNEDDRSDFFLYIDEFQNFTTSSISSILSEARKYRLGLIMAHQYIAQLDEKIRDAVFGNVGTTAAFRISEKDGEFLEKKFGPVFNQNDLINLDNYNAVIKLLINGQTSQPFNFQTITREKGNPEMAREMKELSRQKYGRDREEVEREIKGKYLKKHVEDDDYEF